MGVNYNDANYSPSLSGYSGVKPFRFWCQKVLPLVYDDSLSYYELLNKVVDYLNKTIEDVANVEGNVDALNDSYNQLQTHVNETLGTFRDYINNYFDNLDVQNEIDAKLDEMASSGKLNELIDPLIPSAVTAWLAKNVNPVGSAVVVDNSLSVAGAAADAKVTGDKIGEVENTLNKTIKTFVQYNQNTDFTQDAYFDKNGAIHSESGGNFFVTPSIPTDNVVSVSVRLYQNSTILAPVVFYSAPMVVLSAVTTIDKNIGVGIATGDIAIPDGAKYVRFCCRNADSGQYAQLNYDDGKLFEDILRISDLTVTNVEGDDENAVISQAGFTEINERNAKSVFISDSFPNQGYLKTDGSIKADTTGNFEYSDLIPIPYGIDEIVVKLYCNPTIIAMLSFHDNTGIRISAVTTATGAVSGEVYSGPISVPTGAYYVRATKRVASGEQYVGYDTKYLEAINELTASDNYVFAESLAKPFVNSGANAIGFGDSIMYGYGPDAVVSPNPWPNIVKDRCGFNNFTNRAVGGAGFTVGSTILTQMTGQTLNTRNYIFIAAGTNDYHYTAKLSVFETAVNTAFDYVDANKGPQTKVVIITPINRSQAPRNSNGASLDAYRSILTKCALKHGYSVIDGRNFGFPKTDYDSSYLTAVLTDGLHPTDAGYVMYANHICGLLL